MAKIVFARHRFAGKSHAILKAADCILNEYMAQNIRLSLRQLYYRLVTTGVLTNSISAYRSLMGLMTQGREAGKIDWDALTDHAIWCCARADECRRQTPEVWMEKDTLMGTLGPIIAQFGVPYVICRGQISCATLFDAGYRRFRLLMEQGIKPVVLYIGDHAPNSLEMQQNIEQKLAVFAGNPIIVHKIALRPDQITSDILPCPGASFEARHRQYVHDYGPYCWEVECLEPRLLASFLECALNSA